MPNGRAAKLLGDVLPLGAAPGASSIKALVRSAGRALAAEAEDHGEHFFAEQPLQFPDPRTEPDAHVLELDECYVLTVPERCGGGNSFVILTSRLVELESATGWHAFPIDETINSPTQLHGFLERKGVKINTPNPIIADVGTPTILSWQPAQVILDWVHISMRLRHVWQRLRGLSMTALDPNARLLRYAESDKRRLWHGRL